MIRFTKISSILALATVMASISTTAMASSIGVNTGPSNAGDGSSPEDAQNNVVPPTSTAGIVPQTNWNNVMQGNWGNQQVTDDSGTLLATTVSVQTSWANGNVILDGTPAAADGDRLMMNGGMDNNGGPQGWTITEIPYANYDVYIYYDGGSNGNRGGVYQILDTDNGENVLAAQYGYDTATFDGTYKQATGDGTDGQGQGLDSNYVILTDLTAPNIKIQSIADQLGGGDNVKRAPMNGFQIVEVGGPGPPTITEIDYTSADGMLTLTWNSKPGETYAIKYSEDMISWDSDIDDGYPAAEGGDTTTATFNLNDFGLGIDSRLFFRIEK